MTAVAEKKVPKRSREFYLVSDHRGSKIIRKFKEDADNHATKVDEHVVGSSVCSCKGFSYRRHCKHLDLLNDMRKPQAVSLRVARQAVGELLEGMGLSGVSEAYRVDNTMNVVAAVLWVKTLPEPLDFLQTGSWEGRMKGTGLLVRIVSREETFSESDLTMLER